MILVIAIVVLIFVPWPWGLILFGVLLAGFFGEIAFWNTKLRDRRSDVGSQTLVGRTGQLLSDCRPDGQVRIGGETWMAHCEAGAAAGQTVRVQAVQELTLIVELEH